MIRQATIDDSMPTWREHGGPDADGDVSFDFSVNANSCGPYRLLLEALSTVDVSRYPDGSYLRLREALAHRHGVDVERIVIAASGSEFIFRMTARIAREGGLVVSVPRHAYGDYTDAALAWGMRVQQRSAAPLSEEQMRWFASADVDLIWACDPSSPLGISDPALMHRAPIVLDCAYEPLRLSGVTDWSDDQRDRVWRLYSPNKALGLSGVRGAYAIAPQGQQRTVVALQRMAPSWVLGAHGVAMLMAWCQPAAQAWLLASRSLLRDWKRTQVAMLHSFGWHCLDSDASFFCAQPPERLVQEGMHRLLADLRKHGIKLRDTRSFGLDGLLRMSVQPPLVQRAFETSLQRLVSGVW